MSALIEQILETHPEEFIDDREIAQHIAATLRCDKCQHWEHDALIREDKRQHCFNPDFPKVLCDPRTRPEFFCALWEAKA